MKKRVALGLMVGTLAAAQGMREGSPQDLYFQEAAGAVSGLAYPCEVERPDDVLAGVRVEQACAETSLADVEIRAGVDEAFADLAAPKAWTAQGGPFSERTFLLPEGELRTVVGELAGTGYLFITYVGP